VAQDGAGELGEEALDEVEPGAVLGNESELKAAGRLSSEAIFFSYVRGVVVEDQRVAVWGGWAASSSSRTR
jgi:hypothetical protein